MEGKNIEVISESTIKNKKHYTFIFEGVRVEVEKWWSDEADPFDMFFDFDAGYCIVNETDIRRKLSNEDYEDLLTYINSLI